MISLRHARARETYNQISDPLDMKLKLSPPGDYYTKTNNFTRKYWHGTFFSSEADLNFYSVGGLGPLVINLFGKLPIARKISVQKNIKMLC